MSTTIDEVWLYAYNSSTGPVTLTVQYGGTTSPDNDIKIDVPATSGLTLVVPGLILTGTGAAAVGISATRAVVSSIVMIVIVDGIFAVISYKTGF